MNLLAKQIRKIILEQSRRANVGHIGSALSVADLIAALYGNILRIPSPHDPTRDRFILSKGHAALALYAALFIRGWISEDALNTYCGDATYLGVHPDHHLQGIDFSTGSLGHGLSIGAGSALAGRFQNSSRRVFVLISDAECNEGSLWEAAMFSAHHRLSNLIVLLDWNHQQALGYTRDILDLSPIAARWREFGWDVHEVDGHDIAAIIERISSLEATGRPHIIVARTIFGKPVSFMEGSIKWHYSPLSASEYEQALKELEEHL